jgi:ribulose-phosphate 3-epimerase
MKILPSLMAKNQKEINQLFKHYSGAKELHLDIADGKFVPSKSLSFPFKLSSKFKYNAHLMVKDPIAWIKKNGKRVNLCIASYEAIKDIDKYITFCKTVNKKVAFALKPETKVTSIKTHINQIDTILILTVHPGFYGAKFLKAPLKKIAQIRKLNPKIKIYVDGGMKPSTIQLAKEADHVISGSYLAKSENFKKSMKELKNSL